MSDFADGKDQDDSEFRPIKLDDLEKFTDDPIVSSIGATLDKNKEFTLIYEVEEEVKEDVAFVPFYSKEDKNERANKQSIRDEQSGQEEQSEKEDSAVQEMPHETEEIEKRAYDEGFAKGEKEGFDAGKNRVEMEADNLESIIGQVDNLWKNMVETYEGQIIDLICRAAEKVVYGHVAVEKDIVKKAILDAFEMIPEPSDVTISVNTEDYEFIESTKEDLFENIKKLRNVTVVADPSINRGGCKIETPSGEVNSSIEERMEKIKSSIIETFKIK